MEIIGGGPRLKQIFLENWAEFRKTHPELLNPDIEENVEKMLACREPEKMGFAAYQCKNHPGVLVKIPHSCKSRFCNTCGKIQTDRWIAQCHRLLPNTDYDHITLTIPSELRQLFAAERTLFSALFQAAADTLLSFFEERYHLTPAITAVIHTFGRDMKWNPHIHMIVSSGGLNAEGKWEDIPFIPFAMVQKRWKVKLLNLMKKTIEKKIKETPEHPRLKFFSVPSFLKNFFHDLYGKVWYVHLRLERINVKKTLQYIGRYTKRPVIAETRILNYDGKTVTFIYDDHKDKTATKVTTPVFEFMKKLIRHIPSKRFHQIRHYGLVANRVSNTFKPKLEKLFGKVRQVMEQLTWRQRQTIYRKKDPLICIHCGNEMTFFFRAFFCRSKNDYVFLYS